MTCQKVQFCKISYEHHLITRMSSEYNLAYERVLRTPSGLSLQPDVHKFLEYDLKMLPSYDS